MTLVESLIAVAIFSLVIVAVDGSVTLVSARSNGLSQSSQAIDQLQQAEQTIVEDVHEANSWCSPVPSPSYGCQTLTATPTNTTLTFTASQTGATNVSYKFQITGNALVMTKNNGNATTLVSNLDTTKSGFTVTSVQPAGTGTSTYYNTIGITLTMDSPKVGAPHPVVTTVADSKVEVWNVEFACSIASASDPSGSLSGAPC